MAEIEHEKSLVREWDALAAALDEARRQRDAALQDAEAAQQTIQLLQAQVAALEARVKELEAQVPPPSGAPLLFSDDFRFFPNDDPDPARLYAIDDVQSGITGIGTPEGGGVGLRVTLRWDGALNQAGKCKAELGPRRLGDSPPETLERYARLEFRKAYWFGLTFHVPADWKRDGSKFSIMSIHGSEDPAERGIGRNGNIGIHIVGDRVALWRAWSATETQTGNENVTKSDLINPYVRGTEYRVIINARFDWRPSAEGGGGFTKIWLNGLPILDEEGPNAYNDTEGPYFKFGGYEASWSKPDRKETRPVPADHMVYFTRLRIGDERHTYQDVA